MPLWVRAKTPSRASSARMRPRTASRFGAAGGMRVLIAQHACQHRIGAGGGKLGGAAHQAPAPAAARASYADNNQIAGRQRRQTDAPTIRPDIHPKP